MNPIRRSPTPSCKRVITEGQPIFLISRGIYLQRAHAVTRHGHYHSIQQMANKRQQTRNRNDHTFDISLQSFHLSKLAPINAARHVCLLSDLQISGSERRRSSPPAISTQRKCRAIILARPLAGHIPCSRYCTPVPPPRMVTCNRALEIPCYRTGAPAGLL